LREENRMFKLKIKVGHYYELKLNEGKKIAFAVLYGFERGKNKNVYTTMMYTDHGNFEFPIEESTFDKWVDEGRIKEITPKEALVYAI
jgi:hypothetical protein